MDLEVFNLIIKTLKENNYNIKEIGTVTSVMERNNGKIFDLPDHIKGMIYALLSNQRPWKQIEDNLQLIDQIFHNYNPDYLLKVDPYILVNQIRCIKCGNRSINSQMNALRYNINQFKRIINLYGSMDEFVTSDNHQVIAKSLSEGSFKLKQMGIALVIEYLKNVGIDAFKPDTHIRRLFGNKRLGLTDKEMASSDEVFNIVNKLSLEANTPMVIIDSILWQFCSPDYANICSANPNCSKCLIKTRCNYKKHKI